MRRAAARVSAADAWTLLVAVGLLSPLRRSGYPLGRDMVFTPHQPLTLDSIGLGTAAPRAVPLDALVALASRLVDGATLGRIVLLLPLLAAGCGAWRMLPVRATSTGWVRLIAQVSTAGFAVWNPFVVERLALGQWALLWAYGALPWLVIVAGRLRSGGVSPRTVSGAMLLLGASAITPSGGIIGAAVLLCGGWRRRGRDVAILVLVAMIAQLPWLVPALSAPTGLTSDPGAVSAFAVRSERSGGVLGSLLGLGGIWDAGSTPHSRSGLLGYLTSAVVVAALVTCIGVPVALRKVREESLARLGWSSLGGLLLAAFTLIPGGSAALRFLVRTVPGAGLLRDGQKWIMPLVVLAAVCIGMSLQQLVLLFRQGAPVLALLGLVLPMLLLPDAIATVRPTLTPAHYPAGWYQASAALRASRGRGDVLSLPFASYRSFDWVTATSVIDPAPRWLARPVLVDDRLVVGGRLLAGEDRRAAAVSALLVADEHVPVALAHDLAGAGVGYVWVETDTAGPALPDLSALELVSSGQGVSLYRVPGDVAAARPDLGRRVAVIGADCVVALLMLAALFVIAVQSMRACYTRR